MTLLIGGTAALPASAAGEPVRITWWHNANNDPGRGFWEDVAAEFEEANPNVSIEVVPLQNEEFDTRIPIALQSDDPPDLFQQWGGGRMADQVEAGKLMNITEASADWIDNLGGSAAGWQVGGEQYGAPYTVGIVGFWYNTALFAEAGIETPPATWEEFLVTLQTLEDAEITPIALGAGDLWPAAFWWDYLAVRHCSQEVMEQSAVDYVFDDPCWVAAGETLQQLIDAAPFQEGYLATPAQQGAGSSAGLLGNGEAAMELMGQWNPTTMNGLTPDGEGLGEDLGWFPFPAIEGGAGAPDAALGGGDGFSCSWEAPPECADFLAYIVSPEVNARWAETTVGLPVAAGAEDAVTDPNMQGLLEFRAESSFVQLYLDQAYATSVGQALNDAIGEQFAGALDPEGVVAAIQEAADNR